MCYSISVQVALTFKIIGTVNENKYTEICGWVAEVWKKEKPKPNRYLMIQS